MEREGYLIIATCGEHNAANNMPAVFAPKSRQQKFRSGTQFCSPSIAHPVKNKPSNHSVSSALFDAICTARKVSPPKARKCINLSFGSEGNQRAGIKQPAITLAATQIKRITSHRPNVIQPMYSPFLDLLRHFSFCACYAAVSCRA
jgi:hypothetical protein